jgi:hypothetical protein
MNMKKSIATLILSVLFIFPIKSQEVSNTVFIFSEYHKGNVYFNNRSVIAGVLNYETITQQFFFKQKDMVLSLANPEKVDSVVISGLVFVNNKKNEFLKKVQIDKGVMYVQYRSKNISSSHEVGFGGSSEISNSRSISNVTTFDGGLNFNPNQLTSKDQFKSRTDSLFWIKRNNKFFPVNSVKQTQKAFPEKYKLIQNYILDNKSNFSSFEDVKKLLNYCLSN